jgi:hypothetical protein
MNPCARKEKKIATNKEAFLANSLEDLRIEDIFFNVAKTNRIYPDRSIKPPVAK